MVVLLIGASGSGKDTQAELLKKKYNFEIVSSGDVLRNEIQTKSKLGKKLDLFLSSGKFVPDEMVFDLLGKKVKNNLKRRMIFNGAVRRFSQVFLLDSLLEKNSKKIDYVIYFELDNKTAKERLIKRGRQDDIDEGAIESRLSEFRSSFIDILAEYEKRNILIKIDASKTIDEIHSIIIKELNVEDEKTDS